MSMKLRRRYIFGIICNFFVLLYLFLNFVIRVFDNSIISLRLCLFSLLVSCVCSFFCYSKKNYLCFLYILLFIVSWFIELIFKPEWQYSFDYFVYSVSYMLVAMFLVQWSQQVFALRVLFIFVMVSILVKLLLFDTPIREFMLDESSYNFISVLALLYFGLYCLTLIKNNKPLSLKDGFLFLVVCCLAYGRGGIISALCFLGLLLVYKFYNARIGANKKVLIGFLVLLSIIFFHSLLLERLSDYEIFGKFKKMGMESNGRADIWLKFINNSFSSFKDFILGANPAKIFTEGNLHNSYLQMYANFGFVFFISNVFITILILIYYSRKRSRNIWLLILFVTFIVRALLDRVCFRGHCEILYFYFIFNFFIDISTKNKVVDCKLYKSL